MPTAGQNFDPDELESGTWLTGRSPGQVRSCDTVPGRETLDFRLVFKSLTFVALFAFGCCACVFAYAQGAEPERLAPRASISEKVEEARLLVAIGHFDEVRSMLRAYREAGSTDADLLFVLGLASAGKVQHVQVQEPERQALLDEAVAAFRAVLGRTSGLRARPDRTCDHLFSDKGRPSGEEAFRTGAGGGTAQLGRRKHPSLSRQDGCSQALDDVPRIRSTRIDDDRVYDPRERFQWLRPGFPGLR